MIILSSILKTISSSNYGMSKWAPYDDKDFGPNRIDNPKTNTKEYEIRYYGMTKAYPKEDEIYSKSQVLENQESVNLPNMDYQLYDEVRDLAIDKESEDTVIIKDVTNIFETISLLKIKDEDLPLLYRNLYKKILNVHSKSNDLDYTLKVSKENAIKLIEGFAFKNDMYFDIYAESGILTSEGEGPALKCNYNNVKEFLICENVYHKFSDLDLNDLKLYSLIFKKAQFVRLYIYNCLLSDKFVENLNYLTSVDKIYFLGCVIPENETRENILQRLNFDKVEWNLEELK